MRNGRYAAIDIGTVTCRMLVADVDQRGLHELAKEYAITNLGEGVDASGVLKPQAMQRVVEALQRFLRVRDGLQPVDGSGIATCALATSASRDAQNAAEFVEKLAAIGVSLTVIPGQREAALSFAGASSDFPHQPLLVVDVGGGSTEVAAGSTDQGILQSHSFNVGCRRITEKFFANDPPSPQELDQAKAWVRQAMQPFFAELASRGFQPQRLVAVAGTATTVVSVHEAMQAYDSARVHGYCVTRQVLDQVQQRFLAVPLSQRRQMVGLDPGRAEVIAAGMVILQVVLDLAGASSFTVSESDILQGIILESARAGGAC